MKSKYIDENELAILQEIATSREFLPLAVSLETGLRIGDVLKLKHEDIQYSCINFVAQKTGKAGKARISRALARDLIRPNGSEWCFPGRDKKYPLTRQAVWARVKRICARAGIDPDGISPHSMRKVFAVELYKEEGAEAARRALQHSDLRTTELYVLSDWLTGKNADEPLLRKDIEKIVQEIFSILKMNIDKI